MEPGNEEGWEGRGTRLLKMHSTEQKSRYGKETSDKCQLWLVCFSRRVEQ